VMSATVNRSLATNSLPCKLLFNLRRNGAPGVEFEHGTVRYELIAQTRRSNVRPFPNPPGCGILGRGFGFSI
jgi:hypothetical protein